MAWLNVLEVLKERNRQPRILYLAKLSFENEGDCDHLEGWDREGGREGDARGKRFGNICICISDSLCYKADTNTPL